MSDVAEDGVIKVKGIKTLSRRPNIDKFRIDGLRPEHARIQTYNWVSMTNLIGCLEVISNNRSDFPLMSETHEVLERYGLLCKEFQGNMRLTWVIRPDCYAVDTESLPKDSDIGHFRRDEYRARTFIPLAFSNAILDMAEEGIVKVRSNQLPHMWSLIGETYRKEQFTIIHKGHNNYGKYVLYQNQR